MRCFLRYADDGDVQLKLHVHRPADAYEISNGRHTEQLKTTVNKVRAIFDF